MLLVSPDEKVQIIVRKAVNEDVSRRENDIKTIKTWLRQQPHLPDSWDDIYLMNFLRGTSFSLEKCKRKLDMYFTVRAMVPEFFSNRDISRPELQEVLEKWNLATMPSLTPNGMRVTICAPSERGIEPGKNIADFIKMVFMVADIRLKMEACGSAGEIIIIDCSFELRKHFFKLSLSAVKKFVICAQEAYPVKIKQVHIVNVDPFLDYIISFFKPLLKDKLKERIFVHSKMEDLHELVTKDVLPEECGGTAGKLEMHKCKFSYTGYPNGPSK